MLELRDYQEREISTYGPRQRFGVLWDCGLGKTAGASTIIGRQRLHNVLVLCPDNAFSVWRDEAPRWIKTEWPDVNIQLTIMDAPPWARPHLWQIHIARSLPGSLWPPMVNLTICTPDTFIRDWGESVVLPGKKKKSVKLKPLLGYHFPDLVIFDEAKRMRNPDSKIFQVLSRYLGYYNVPGFIPMTGTPGHLPRDFWTMLHCINPRLFRSYWQFIQTFHEVLDNGFGSEIIGPRNLDRWEPLLRSHFSVVREDDPGIADQRPPITRQLLPIMMDDDQAHLYEELKNELMAFRGDDLIIAQNEFALGTRLRQTLICPQILSPSLGVGASIRDFAEIVNPEEHNVIFTPFTAAFEPFQSYLKLRGFKHIYTLRGGMGTEGRDQTLALYRAQGGTLICSILYAQAFSLEPGTRCYFIGYDWDPDNNRQAEKRLHRLTTRNPITAYYYTMRSTFDEKLAYIVNIKQQHVNMTILSNLKELVNNEPTKI